MKTSTLTLVTEIVERGGFITEADMVTLLSDDTVRNADTLLRYDAGRKVVPLKDVAETIQHDERCGNYLRDVSFTASQCATFLHHL